MKWKSICLMVFFICAVAHVPVFAGAPAHDKAALVNGEPITDVDFRTELNRIERQRGTTKSSPDSADVARMKKEALENLIIRELLFREAGKQGIKAPEAAVSVEMDGLKKQFSGAGEYETTLGRMGLSDAAVRAQVAKGMVIRRFIDANFADRVKVTDKDIAIYYDDHLDEFKIAGQQHAGFLPLEEVRERISRKIKQERVQKALSPYLKRLRETARVEILLDEDED